MHQYKGESMKIAIIIALIVTSIMYVLFWAGLHNLDR